MDRNSFYYLFINSQGALELAMQLLVEQLEAEEPCEQPPKTEEELAELRAKEAEYWKNFELEALKPENAGVDPLRMLALMSDQLNGQTDDQTDDQSSDQQIVLEAPPLSELTAEQVAAREASIERYLADAYSRETELQPVVDQCYQELDLPALTAAVARLPSDLPPLTAALSAEEMARWVRLQEANNPELDEVVLHFRRWAMSALDESLAADPLTSLPSA